MTCPICKKSVSKIITQTLRTGEKRKVFLCTRCELGILDSHASKEELEKFYATEYRAVGRPKLTGTSSPAELFEIYSKFQDERLKLLKPYMKKSSRLLEVGCSAGMFLYHAKKHVREIVGIDFDQASAQYAAKKCNCKVYTTEITKTPLKKSYFDIIVAFQTLEHVQDPVGFVSDLTEYLAPGGILVIEVPNLHDILAYVFDLPNHYQFFYHSSHLWYFTKKSLSKLAGQAGLKGNVHHLQDYNILNHMNWVNNDKPQGTPLPGLSLPIFPFKKEASNKIKQTLGRFLAETDTQYKKLLKDLRITSNILFIGTKK